MKASLISAIWACNLRAIFDVIKSTNPISFNSKFKHALSLSSISTTHTTQVVPSTAIELR
jgi:hypothetical protein